MIPMEELRKRGQVRACDGCTVCCYVLDVPEVKTTFRSLCQHATPGKGCALWQWRPGTPRGQPIACAHYQCLWLTGLGEEEDRPEDSGVLIDLRLKDGEVGIYAIGVNEGDENRPEAREAMQRIASQTGHPVHLADKDLNVLEVIHDNGNGSEQ